MLAQKTIGWQSEMFNKIVEEVERSLSGPGLRGLCNSSYNYVTVQIDLPQLRRDLSELKSIMKETQRKTEGTALDKVKAFLRGESHVPRVDYNRNVVKRSMRCLSRIVERNKSREQEFRRAYFGAKKQMNLQKARIDALTEIIRRAQQVYQELNTTLHSSNSEKVESIREFVKEKYEQERAINEKRKQKMAKLNQAIAKLRDRTAKLEKLSFSDSDLFPAYDSTAKLEKLSFSDSDLFPAYDSTAKLEKLSFSDSDSFPAYDPTAKRKPENSSEPSLERSLQEVDDVKRLLESESYMSFAGDEYNLSLEETMDNMEADIYKAQCLAEDAAVKMLVLDKMVDFYHTTRKNMKVAVRMGEKALRTANAIDEVSKGIQNYFEGVSEMFEHTVRLYACMDVFKGDLDTLVDAANAQADIMQQHADIDPGAGLVPQILGIEGVRSTDSLVNAARRVYSKRFSTPRYSQ